MTEVVLVEATDAYTLVALKGPLDAGGVGEADLNWRFGPADATKRFREAAAPGHGPRRRGLVLVRGMARSIEHRIVGGRNRRSVALVKR